MATKLYLSAQSAPYSPATLRGAWDDTASAVTKALHVTARPIDTPPISSIGVAETSTSNDWDVLLYRGVSGPLAAQTVSGTVDVSIAVGQTSGSMNAHWHVHIYATQGDSDTPRGTLLTDYTEAAGTNEWPASWPSWGNERGLNASQSLSSLAVSAGDRLVIEIGYVARNTSATSYTGGLQYGVTADDGRDLADNEGVYANDYYCGNAFVVFSADLTWAAEQANLTQHHLEVGGSQSGAVRLTQHHLETANRHSAPVRLTQEYVEVGMPRPVPVWVTQEYLEIAYPYVEEVFEPGQSFGPLVWVEVLGPDGDTRAYAPVALPDPSTYYWGWKPPALLNVGRVARALSDEDGQYESQRFSTTLDDMDRQWRIWLGDMATRLILNKRVVLRMISEPAWRAKLRPRTVALGLIRDYRLE